MCLDDDRHQETKNGEKKWVHLKDWKPIRPSAEGYSPEGDLLIGSGGHKVRLGIKAGMKNRG